MTLRSRFLLISIGIVIFTLTTPVIVLFALGYKVDFQNRQIVQTGTLIIKSEPEKAAIYIDDVLQRDETDATIRFLLPGDYNIKLEKNGYQSWTKRLNIRSRLVTWANFERDFVTLFFAAPETKQTAKISQSIVSQKNYDSIVIEGEAVIRVDGSRGQRQNLNKVPPAISPPAALPEQALYYWLRYPPARTFPAEQLSAARQLEANDAYGIILNGATLQQSKNQTVTTLAEQVSGFHLENEHLWFVQNNELRHANLDLGVIELVETLPYSPTASKIIRGDSRLFLLLDQRLYAINDEPQEIYNGVTAANWSKTARKLVYANNNEILVYDTNTLQSELIVRSTTAVANPILNQRTGYLFFSNEGKIKAIEMDGRDHRNVYTLLDLPTGSFLVSDDGTLILTFTDTEFKEYQIR